MYYGWLYVLYTVISVLEVFNLSKDGGATLFDLRASNLYNKKANLYNTVSFNG